ncbi:MAG TPA: hypothetical protein VK249_19140 [Anaerolineales bacterium]|nr:hypothetical protein [Anaerolineales bacterium]
MQKTEPPVSVPLLDSEATINSLDLVGEQGRGISDVPQDLAMEGDNLWVLTSRQLLRIKVP